MPREMTVAAIQTSYGEDMAANIAKPARFIREAALGQSLKARHHAETNHLLRALARIGRSLEQVERLTRIGRGTAFAKLLAQARAEHHAVAQRLMQDGRRGARRSAR